MVYFSDQPSNRPTNTIYILIINELHVGWYVNQPNQPDQPSQFRQSAPHRKRLPTTNRWNPTTNHDQPKAPNNQP
ncbi:hypothetical protein [Prevotella merdae]|uniref:hypothetical protein n=1 Tax=Prevotella merdae TaxID=2079531 RepID=UPI0027E2346D|nr:hypothetical protein [uncultured Prevotella sp.]